MGLEWNLLGPPIRFPIPFELSIQGLGIAGIGCVGMQISGQSRENRGDIDNLRSTQLIIFRRCFISRLVNISSRDGMSCNLFGRIKGVKELGSILQRNGSVRGESGWN